MVVPAAKPATMPVLPMLPMPVWLLLQLPPLVVLLRVVVLPSHSAAVPLMAAGDVLTVTVAVVRQPPLNA